ncbi:MAG: vitamin K epoxide reductase family protein [Parabacteroides sp.]|nr:vitamin K epoxide reductase family protein [Parabacteroides sp.]
MSEKVCKIGKYTGCEDVLNSPAAKIGNISMSDIGIVYFAGGIFTLALSVYVGQQYLVFPVLLLFSLCSIPYILFSISYQAFKVRKWCPFCLSVIFMLLLECLLAIFDMKSYSFDTSLLQGITLCGLCFL